MDRVADFLQPFLQSCPAYSKDPPPIPVMDTVAWQKEEFRRPQGQDAGKPPPKVYREKVVLCVFTSSSPELIDIPVKSQVIPEIRQLPRFTGPSVQRPVFLDPLHDGPYVPGWIRDHTQELECMADMYIPCACFPESTAPQPDQGAADPGNRTGRHCPKQQHCIGLHIIQEAPLVTAGPLLDCAATGLEADVPAFHFIRDPPFRIREWAPVDHSFCGILGKFPLRLQARSGVHFTDEQHFCIPFMHLHICYHLYLSASFPASLSWSPYPRRGKASEGFRASARQPVWSLWTGCFSGVPVPARMPCFSVPLSRCIPSSADGRPLS